jgi:hypothetical protein
MASAAPSPAAAPRLRAGCAGPALGVSGSRVLAGPSHRRRVAANVSAMPAAIAARSAYPARNGAPRPRTAVMSAGPAVAPRL